MRADDHDLADRERARLLHDAALLVLRRVRLRVTLADVHARDDHGALTRVHFLAAAALPAVLARDHHDLVALAEPQTGGHLKHLRRERDDLHEVPLAQLSRDRAEDTRAAGLALRVEEHRRVVVEADVAPVVAAIFLGLAHDDRPHDLALLHAGVRDRVLDRRDEHVPDLDGLARARAPRPDAPKPPRYPAF